MDRDLIEIVEKARTGDKKAFEQLCEKKGKDILYIAIHFMNNFQDGEDAAQEVLLYMQKNITKLKSAEAFQVWLYRIMRSTCLNMKRKTEKKDLSYDYYEQEILEERAEFLPYEFVEDKYKREKVLSIINELPHQCMMCIFLFYYEHLSYLEIAQILNISKKDVDNTLMKAKRIIRKKVEQDTSLKKLLSNFYGVAPVPIMTQILKADAAESVSGASISRLMEICSIGAAGTVVGTSLGKAAVRIILSAGVITGGVWLYMNQAASGYQGQQSGLSAKTIQTSQLLDAITFYEKKEADKDIKTLEDMIGIEEAGILRGYTEETGDQSEELDLFLEEIGMETGESAWRVGTRTEDTLYLLQKKNKMLLIITRKAESGDYLGVRFLFTDIDETIPEDIEISICYEEWREE